MSFYQIITLGSLDQRFDAFMKELDTRTQELGLSVSDFVFMNESDFPKYDRIKPAVAVYFGDAELSPASPFLNKLLADSIVVIPVVSSRIFVENEIPAKLTHINALELSQDSDSLSRLVSLVLENFRLLRKERGIFISYRRKGSQPLANRLYEELDKRGFDVFIDI